MSPQRKLRLKKIETNPKDMLPKLLISLHQRILRKKRGKRMLKKLLGSNPQKGSPKENYRKRVPRQLPVSPPAAYNYDLVAALFESITEDTRTFQKSPVSKSQSRPIHPPSSHRPCRSFGSERTLSFLSVSVKPRRLQPIKFLLFIGSCPHLC
jgi:hypothetical protein